MGTKKGSNPNPPDVSLRPAPPPGPPKAVEVAHLQTKTDKDAAKLASALTQTKRMSKELIEVQEVIAKIQRERYLQLIKSGFNEQQALFLASKAGLTI